MKLKQEDEKFKRMFSKTPVPIPVPNKVFEDYDELDALAESYGYSSMGNNSEYCGWIATMGDQFHDTKKMLAEANAKLEAAKSKGADAIIGFCQTGNFSVGYTIYVKRK